MKIVIKWKVAQFFTLSEASLQTVSHQIGKHFCPFSPIVEKFTRATAHQSIFLNNRIIRA
jgi:hypothetical protein